VMAPADAFAELMARDEAEIDPGLDRTIGVESLLPGA